MFRCHSRNGNEGGDSGCSAAVCDPGGGGREQKRGNNRGEKGVSERTQMIGRV